MLVGFADKTEATFQLLTFLRHDDVQLEVSSQDSMEVAYALDGPVHDDKNGRREIVRKPLEQACDCLHAIGRGANRHDIQSRMRPRRNSAPIVPHA